MAKDVQEVVKKRLKEGWLKVRMDIEVLATTEDAARGSLEKHVEKMEKHDFCVIYRKDFGSVDKVKNPFNPKQDAYSNVVQVEMVCRLFDNVVFLVMNYAPTSVEILEPVEIKMKLGEAQGILNSLSELIHTFASVNAGGVTIST